MKKSKKQSNLKVLATTSALIGVCCVGSGLNAETASASTTRIPTINTSTQTGGSSLGARLWTNIKKPFTGAGNLFGRAWNSLKGCFGLKSSSTNENFDFEMEPVSNSDKSKTLKRTVKPPYGQNSSKINTISGSKQSKPDITYAHLDFSESGSTNGVKPRTEPETIYAQIRTQSPTNPNQMTVTADVHAPSSGSTTTPPPVPPKSSPAKTGTDNQGFDGDNSPTTKPRTFYQDYKPTSDIYNLGFSGDDGSSASGGTSSSTKPKKVSFTSTGIDNQGFDDENSSNKSSNQNYLVLTTSGGSSSSTKPKKLFYDPQFDTDEFGSNPDKDPIYQPLSDFTSTSQTQTSSTSSGGGIGKKPLPAPRTKLQTKQ